MIENPDVLIVGGGFSGTALAANLVKRNSNLSVIVSQKPDGPAFGIAYQTDCPLHLLNVPARGMSALADAPNDFVEWAASNGTPLDPREFAPRRLYREYLTSIQNRSVASGQVTVLVDETVRVHRESLGWRCFFESGESVLARSVVLAFGGFPRSYVPELAEVHEHVSFISNPWTNAIPVDGGAETIIGLIGSGLTAVDTVLACEANGFKGKYVMLSRRGLLPMKHDLDVPPFPADELPKPNPSIRQLLRELRAASTRAEELGTNWRAVFDGMRPKVSQYWLALNVAERKRFLRHLRSFWEVHRHRMAPEIAEHIGRLRADKRLISVAGRIMPSREAGSKLVIPFVSSRSKSVEIYRFDLVVNCTGPSNRVKSLPSSLIQDLLADGVTETDTLDLGISSDEHGQVLSPFRETQDGLYVLGLLRRGQLWESTAVPELRAQAADLSTVLQMRMASLKSR